MVRAGHGNEIGATIHVLAPFWDHNSGYGMLGKAAFKCGEDTLAESFFLKLHNNYRDSHRSEEMGLLAEIWCKRGKQGDARILLMDCLRKLVNESRTATGSDKRLFENWFQNQSGTWLRLFPSEGEIALAAAAIPSSTLN